MSNALKRKSPSKKKDSLVLVDQKVPADGVQGFMYTWKEKYLVPVSITKDKHLIGITIEEDQREPSLAEMEEVLLKLGMVGYDNHVIERYEEEGFYTHFFSKGYASKPRRR